MMSRPLLIVCLVIALAFAGLGAYAWFLEQRLQSASEKVLGLQLQLEGYSATLSVLEQTQKAQAQALAKAGESNRKLRQHTQTKIRGVLAAKIPEGQAPEVWAVEQLKGSAW